MLATDLKIDGRAGSFGSAQVNGSLAIEVWESDDLVDWSAQRHEVVNIPNASDAPYAGNTWAPEAYWDDDLGTYVVYWAANLYDKQNPTERDNTPTYNRMMYVTTDDFVNFSQPKVWVDVDRRGQAGAGSIDVTVQKVGDEYVRVYKDENSMSLRQEQSTDMLATVGGAGVKNYSETVGAASGEWQQMGEKIGNDQSNGYGGTFTGGEGPSLFKANPDDVNDYQYYLFADQPNYHGGPNHYVPMATEDITDASKWKVIGDEMPAKNFPTNVDGGMPRHGTVIPVTAAEHQAVEEGLGVVDDGDDGENPDPVDGLLADYSFDQTTGDTIENDGGNAGDATVQNQADSQWTGDSLKFTGGAKTGSGDWVKLPKNLLSGEKSASITTEVKIDKSMKTAYNFLWNIGTDGNTTQYFFASAKDPSRTAITTSSNSGEASADAKAALDQDRWYQLTTVLDGDAGELRYYVDGVLAGKKATALTPADITNQSVSTIGRSPWPDDLFKGEVAKFRVYNRALDADEVDDYNLEDAQLHKTDIKAFAQNTLDELNVPEGDITTDYVSLPTGGGAVAWTSSNPAVIETDGTVVQPAQDADPVEVTLTAKTTIRGISAEREVTVTVQPSTDTDDARTQRAAERYVIPNLLAAGAHLPEAPDGIIVTPVSATDGAKLDGDVIGLESGRTDVTSHVTVEIAREATPDRKVTKTFTIRVLPESATRELAAYHRTPTTVGEANNADVALSMHLALQQGTQNLLLNPDTWSPLNENYGIYFPKVASPVPASGVDTSLDRSLVNPSVFALKGEGYGVVSTRVLRGGGVESSTADQVLLATSDDLRGYEEVGLLTLDESNGVNHPTAIYDAAEDDYVVSWTTDAGTKRHQVFDDLVDAVKHPSDDGASASGRATGSHIAEDLDIADFAGGVTLTVTADEAKALDQRFGRLTNTGYTAYDDVKVAQGGTVSESDLPSDVELTYSDGSKKSLPVDDWDVTSVDTSKTGTYEVTGAVKQTTYPRPFAVERADPSAFKYSLNGEDKYLMIATNDPNGDNVSQGGKAFMPFRIADTLSGLADEADPIEVHLLDRGDVDAQGKTMTGCFWAPEFHVIGGKLSILFMPCYNSSPSYVTGRASIMQLQQNADGSDKDPADPASWSTPQWILQQDGSNLNTDQPVAANQISLDMTYFQDGDGQAYYAWQQNCSTYISKVDPGNPTVVTTKPVRIGAPEYAWDNSCAEGSNVLVHGDKLLMTYAGSSVGDTYTTGLATASLKGTDLTSPGSWSKLNYPLLKSGMYEGDWQLGTGHGMWSEDEDGNIIYVFHARTDAGGTGRDMLVRRVHFDAEGMPILDMSSEEEVASATVKLKVVVTPKSSVDPCKHPSQASPFTDVPVSHKYYSHISWLYCSKITTGVKQSDGTVKYLPDSSVTREQMAVFLYKQAGSPKVKLPKKSPFTDVKTTDAHFKQIAWMYQEGIAKGSEQADGTRKYLPASHATRGQMAAFMYGAAGKPKFTAPSKSPFVDVKKSDAYYKQIAWMRAKKISAGSKQANGSRKYVSSALVTRGQMAVFLHKFDTLGY